MYIDADAGGSSLITLSSDAGGSPSIYVSGVFCVLYDKAHTEVRIFRIPTIILMISPVCDVFLGVRLLPANLHPIYHAGSWVHPVGQLTPIIHLVVFGFHRGRSFFFVLHRLFCVYFCRLFGWVVVSSYLRHFVHPACSFCVYLWTVFACVGLCFCGWYHIVLRLFRVISNLPVVRRLVVIGTGTGTRPDTGIGTGAGTGTDPASEG